MIGLSDIDRDGENKRSRNDGKEGKGQREGEEGDIALIGIIVILPGFKEMCCVNMK